MKRETKFNIGDKICFIEYTASKCDYCNDLDCDDCNREADQRFKMYRVKEGAIKLIQSNAIITTNNKYIYKEDCFATEAEAQVEADRRNNAK